MSPSPNARVLGVVGYPVRHSLSPALHRAAYERLGLDWSYLIFEVPARSFAQAVSGARSLGFYGLSVTMPHKEQAAALSTRRSAAVRRLGAANTLSFRGDEIAGDSTDGAGLIDDLWQGAAFDPAGRRCGVIGAGGAARAVLVALAEAGAAELVVVNRTRSRAWQAAALEPAVARVARPEDLGGCDLVVQATPVTMGPPESEGERAGTLRAAGEGAGAFVARLVDGAGLGSGQLVVDLSYHPATNWFLQAAAAKGARTRNGLGMLVHQAAHQVRIWTGSEPPLDAMWAAVTAAGLQPDRPELTPPKPEQQA